ncbi:DNA-binding transcriptional MerR regulator [Geodermatophilus bullaregiensis]|uniref:transcriptional regulator FtsR n=1 Tax=Geodermatophilus bullaregiensis TaxID=1564160 RepID=UPI00195F01F4|nr:MerR family transcriptional regulator [Geodermatophilus bullaregiensis]MBM7804323.1 DNA-binding transcriptional MerR regulator [Geodermatophilus bullaregiensis]
MPGARAGASGDDAAGVHAPRLTIGAVLAALRDDFPDVTISKIRYLESEDLVHPQRTPSGYRKFSRADVDRLRYVLTAQRDHYLPLRVIKEHLDALDRGLPLPGTGPAVPPPAPGPDRPRQGTDGEPAEAAVPPLTPDEFARAAGLDRDQLADCVQFGLLAPDADGRHPAGDLPIAQAAAGLARHGFEPRHLRAFRTGAEREAGLVEQLVAPVLRSRSEDARARATEKLAELAALSAQLHRALLEARLRDLLRP